MAEPAGGIDTSVHAANVGIHLITGGGRLLALRMRLPAQHNRCRCEESNRPNAGAKATNQHRSISLL
jgi:hypothetical protein